MTAVQAQEARVFWLIIFSRGCRGGRIMSLELGPWKHTDPSRDGLLERRMRRWLAGKGGTRGTGDGGQPVDDGRTGLKEEPEDRAADALSGGDAG